MDSISVSNLIDNIARQGALGSGDRQLALLRYLVREEIEGRGQGLKAFSIAVDVFGRPDSFDPQSNSIVRVEVGRLRRALELYFATDGQNERISIVIPKGGYRPIFVTKTEPAAATPSRDTPQKNSPQTLSVLKIGRNFVIMATLALFMTIIFTMTMYWYSNDLNSPEKQLIALNSIEVFPVVNGSGNSQADSLALSLTAEMQRRIGNIKTLKVVLSDRPREVGWSTTHHILSGTIVNTNNQLSIYLSLVRPRAKELIWSERYPIEINLNNELLQMTISRAVYDLRAQIFASVRQLIEKDRWRPASPTELFLLATWFPGYAESSMKWELERVALARQALAYDPKFGPAHSVLAEKLAFLANVNYQWDTDSIWKEAREHLRSAEQYSGEDPETVFNVALHYWHAGLLEKSMLAIERVKDLHSGHPLANFMSMAIPFTCSPATLEAIAKLKQFDHSLESANPIRWVTLGWLARLHFNRQEYALALEYGRSANHIFYIPDTTFLVAASYAHLSNFDEAKKILENQRKFWPNLDARHYVEKSMPRRCATSKHKDVIVSAYAILNSMGHAR